MFPEFRRVLFSVLLSIFSDLRVKIELRAESLRFCDASSNSAAACSAREEMGEEDAEETEDAVETGDVKETGDVEGGKDAEGTGTGKFCDAVSDGVSR